MNEAVRDRVSGRRVVAPEIALIREVAAACAGLSRKELANTISELLGWTRPSGALKEPECLALLVRLEVAGLLTLPAKQRTRPVGSVTSVPRTARGEPAPRLTGRVDTFAPVQLHRVQHPAERQLFRELVSRYHYLSYRVPFGAHVQYLVSIAQPKPTVVGCLQFSSAGWRMRARDAWIGWDDVTRARQLSQVVSNSRFLLLPWVRIQNLASTALALALRRLPADWQATYGVTPLLVETLVDPARYSGGCYRAANWIEVGQTAGRGRDDRRHHRHGARPKRVFVYPLIRDAVTQLREAKPIAPGRLAQSLNRGWPPRSGM
ncbi:MAG TPA: Druantia anti-phage system protein DruA [Vicinamibacterales bacterium]